MKRLFFILAAVMMAASMNARDVLQDSVPNGAQTSISSNVYTSEGSQTEAPEEQVIQAFEIKDASPKYGDCIMNLISIDGIDSTIEKISLKFKGITEPTPLPTHDDHDVFRKATIYELDSLCAYENGYGVIGKGKYWETYYNMWFDPVSKFESKKPIISVEISENFFNFLYENLGAYFPTILKKSQIRIYD